MENEIWRPVKGYEGLYEVSNFGRVKSLYRYNKILRPGRVLNYYRITLCGKTRKNHLIHRLVAIAFPEICGEWFEGAVCNHKDENGFNNRADNLEWVTQEYNLNYGTRTVRASASKTNGKTAKEVLQYDLEGNFIKEWPSVGEIQRQLDYDKSHISKCCLNKPKYKTYKGFIWKYKEEVA